MTNDPLLLIGHVALPKHEGKGAFDHAAVHAASGHVYVAHTANDAVDVFDPASRKHLFSVPRLPGVAGVLVSDEAQLVITSNRAENTIGVFAPGPDPQVLKIAVGVQPNGLAYDHGRRLILAANVGDPQIPGSQTISMVDLDAQAMLAEIRVPGRTRWAVYDPDAQVFYVNIADPAQIVIVDARNPPGRRSCLPRSVGRPSRARPRPHHASSLLRLRLGRLDHARRANWQGHGRESPERHARRRLLQSRARTALRCRRRPGRDRRVSPPPRWRAWAGSRRRRERTRWHSRRRVTGSLPSCRRLIARRSIRSATTDVQTLNEGEQR